MEPLSTAASCYFHSKSFCCHLLFLCSNNVLLHRHSIHSWILLISAVASSIMAECTLSRLTVVSSLALFISSSTAFSIRLFAFAEKIIHWLWFLLCAQFQGSTEQRNTFQPHWYLADTVLDSNKHVKYPVLKIPSLSLRKNDGYFATSCSPFDATFIRAFDFNNVFTRAKTIYNSIWTCT